MSLDAKKDQIQKDFAKLQGQKSSWEKQLEELSIQNIGLDDEDEDVELEQYDPMELHEVDIKACKESIGEMEHEIKNSNPNLGVLKEFKEKRQEYLVKVSELKDITAKRDQAKNDLDSICKQRLDEFMEGFKIISMKLKEMYQVFLID